MTQTPTITRVSLEPFCPVCGGNLHVQGYDEVTISWIEHTADGYGYQKSTQFLILICPWCGKELQTSAVAWREREKEEG